MARSSGRILIVGAGIGGLTAALALSRAAFDVEVYEQASELREFGAGIQISPNGTRVLHALGLESALAACAVRPQMKEVRHWKTDGTWNLFELGAVWVERYGAPDIFIHRGDLQRVLAEAVSAAAPSAIKLDARCVGIEQTADCARIHLERGGTAEGRLLIGADGVHSQVRAELFGAAKTAIHPLHRVARDHPGGAA